VEKSFNISIPSASEHEIKLMTWNVRNFDLYNWSNNEATRDNMMDLIASEKPDILCLQEFYTTKRGSFNNIQRILDKINFEQYYFGETFTLKEGFRKWGLSIFSKYPIVNTGLINFENATRLNAFVFADLLIDEDTVRVYNMRLQSISFNESDYQFFKEIKEQPQWNSNSAKVLQKIKFSTQIRAKQALKMKAHSKTFKGKVIFAGDFNEPAVTFTYKTIAKDMQDTFSKKGFGFGKTYINPSPFFKIDYVLVDERFKVLSHKVLKKAYSDHYPVVVTFESD
jgi:endonuclease/exonuclease/phosphatase family metal-dependent hydrolase